MELSGPTVFGAHNLHEVAILLGVNADHNVPVTDCVCKL